jgi:hypothetical protein
MVSVRVADVPVAHTPPGGYGPVMPAPILQGCVGPLAAGAPDLRGLWEVVTAEVGGSFVADHPVIGNRQRIEQSGDRLVVTASGVIHDMRCDGTVEHGVRDVMQTDFVTPIAVVATYEDGFHVLRPEGVDIEVTRRRDGAQLVWDYAGLFVARLDRVEETGR